MSDPMSDEEYVRHEGRLCPVCRSRNLDGGSVEIGSSVAWQPVRCYDCDSKWNDQYHLAGYDWLETKNKEDEQ